MSLTKKWTQKGPLFLAVLSIPLAVVACLPESAGDAAKKASEAVNSGNLSGQNKGTPRKVTKATADQRSNLNRAFAGKQLPYTDNRRVGTQNVGNESERRVGYAICKIQKKREYRKYAQNILFDPSQDDVFFPGAILKGETVQDGSYETFQSGNRTDVDISIKAKGARGSIKKVVQPTLSDVRQKITDLLTESVPQETTSTFVKTISRVYDKEHVKFVLKAGSFDNGTQTLNNGIQTLDFDKLFDFETDTLEGSPKVRFMVQVTREYYRINVDALPSAAHYFHDATLVDTSSVTKKPVYVSAVSYGNM